MDEDKHGNMQPLFWTLVLVIFGRIFFNSSDTK